MASVEVFDLIRSAGIIPLFSSGSVRTLEQVARALDKAGVTVFEVTMRREGALEAFTRLGAVLDDLPLRLAAGTVLDRPTAEWVIAAGAQLVLSPTIVPEVAAACAEGGVPYVPGCATPNEVQAARALGCRVVKLFPAAAAGPSFIGAVRAVFPDVEYIPSGGISATPDALRPWFAAGIVAVGMGSNLIEGSDPDPEEVGRRTSAALAIVGAVRGSA